MDHQTKGASKALYALGGVAIGAGLGLLLAPKPGNELREDIAQWRRRQRDFLGKRLQQRGSRVLNEARNQGEEALRDVKESIGDRA